MIFRYGGQENRYGLLRRFIKKKYLKSEILCSLHKQPSVAYCGDETNGEIRVISPIFCCTGR
jgi:hypothetical protein